MSNAQEQECEMPKIERFTFAVIAAVFVWTINAVHADQSDTLEADTALANKIYEREQTIREIIDWADERARTALYNTNVMRPKMDDHNRELNTCYAKANTEDEFFKRSAILTCDTKKLVGPFLTPTDKTVVRELRAKFIHERLEQERDALGDELLKHMQRMLDGTDESPVI